MIIERLLEDGEFPGPGLYGHHPLDHDDAQQEAGLTRVLQVLPVLVGPLLVVAVSQVIDGEGVPFIANIYK